jgi:methanogenic corrinoid protein MtbC1
LYSERDIALLRWIKTQMEKGTTISRVVAEFQTMRRAGEWPEAVSALPPHPLHESQTPPDLYAKRLFAALKSVNESQASAVLREAHALFDLTAICLNIIQPCLYEIGEAWYRGEIRIATEHFASQFLRGQLLTLFQAHPMRHSAPRIVVSCAPNEFHDIGSLMLALFLRREGYRVEFIGADAHLEDLSEYVRDERPALVCLSANSEAAARGLRQMDARLAGMRPRPRFAFGGRIFNTKPALRNIIPGLFLGEDARQAVDQIRELLPL